MITNDAITSFIRQLEAEATCGSTGNEWTFANGESVFRCTSSARRIAEAFGGIVVGFSSDDNPAAEILDGEDGHDFALIADRFVVDYWGAYAAGVIDRSVFDLLAASDRATVLRLYGTREAWKRVRPMGPKGRAVTWIYKTIT